MGEGPCQCGHSYGAHEWIDDALYGYCTRCDCHKYIKDESDEYDDEAEGRKGEGGLDA